MDPKDVYKRLAAYAADIEQARRLLDAQRMAGRLYRVCHTNAKLENLGVIAENVSYDIAETQLANAFTDSDRMEDFLMYEAYTGQKVVSALSQKSLDEQKGVQE